MFHGVFSSAEYFDPTRLEHLKGLTSLTTLLLARTQITDTGLAEIKAALPKCRVE